VRLCSPQPPNSDGITSFQLSPDSTRAVYSQYGLWIFSAPVDGSAPEVALGTGLQEHYLIGADSSFVVVQTNTALVRVPIAGGSAQTLAPFDAPSGRNTVESLALSPLGTHVVYVSDPSVNDRFELSRVPVDGSAPPEVLSGTPGASDSVFEFEVASDQSRVVYRERVYTSPGVWTMELRSVPFDGSASPVRLNPPLNWLSSVVGFRLSADGSTAVYRADPTDTVFELFAVPAAGGRPAVRLSAPAAVNGGVQADFALTPRGERALFRLDTKLEDAFELFESPLVREAQSSGPPR